MNEVKMMIVMRKDLNMRKGKMVAQGSHAAVGLALELERNLEDGNAYTTNAANYQSWLASSFKKICVSVNSEQELCELYGKLCQADLPAKLITDAGHTEFDGVPTKTCLATLGTAEKLADLTGKLPLL